MANSASLCLRRHQPGCIINLAAWQKLLLDNSVTLVTFAPISNATGAIQPTQALTAIAHQRGAWVMLDASQLAGHAKIDVQQLDCDFLCFSGHKLGSPSGIGVCYVRRSVAPRLVPFKFGGGMVTTVEPNSYSLAEFPRSKPGLPSIEAAIGLAAACLYMDEIGMTAIAEYEQQLTANYSTLSRRCPAYIWWAHWI